MPTFTFPIHVPKKSPWVYEGEVTVLDYEGPDLSPGVKEGRPNIMRDLGRGTPAGRKHDSRIDDSEGGRA